MTTTTPTFEHLNEYSRERAIATWTRDQAVIDKLADIAKTLSAATGETFIPQVIPHHDQDYGGRDITLGHGKTGACINLTTNSRDSKIHVSADYPRKKDGSLPYLRTEDHIKAIDISTTKAADVIGREIARRFWPGYLATWTKLKADVDGADAYEAKSQANAQRLADALGVDRRPRHNGGPLSTEIYVRRKGAYTASVSGDSVTIERLNLPLDLAIKILTALPKD